MPRTPPTPREVQLAHRRLAQWLRWYMRHYGVQSEVKLAALMGVSDSTVHLFLAREDRAPNFRTLLGAARLLEYPLDVLLFQDPPPDAPK